MQRPARELEDCTTGRNKDKRTGHVVSRDEKCEHNLARSLRHLSWRAVDARDLHSACLELEHEQYEVAPEPSQGEHLYGEQIGCRQTFPASLE